MSTIGESGRRLVGQPYPWCLQDGQPGLQSVLHMRRVSLSLAGSWSCSLLLGTCTMYITLYYYYYLLYFLYILSLFQGLRQFRLIFIQQFLHFFISFSLATFTVH